jgi:hypothetical protein
MEAAEAEAAEEGAAEAAAEADAHRSTGAHPLTPSG